MVFSHILIMFSVFKQLSNRDIALIASLAIYVPFQERRVELTSFAIELFKFYTVKSTTVASCPTQGRSEISRFQNILF